MTSPRGAAIQDILNILRRRHESVSVLIYPAQVQGEGAAAEVSAGVRYFNRHGKVDVIVVARGGGSFEDLFAFNDEGLARTIAAAQVPVISAVGHEIDFTICDFVADLRAPTPSAAAELVIGSKQELAERLASLRRRLGQAVNYKLLRAHNALSRLAQHEVFARMRDSIARRQQRLDDLVFRMAQSQSEALKNLSRRLGQVDANLRHHDPRVRLALMRRQLDGQTATLQSSMTRQLVSRHNEIEGLRMALGRAGQTILLRRRSRWQQLHSSLEALSPKTILARGYALVFDDAGRLVKQAAQLKPGSRVRTQLGHGEFTANVEKVKHEP